MAEPRIQADVGLAPEKVRPVASPVDTFARPTAGNELQQLASGLAQFAPALGRFTDIHNDRANQQAEAQAEADFQRIRLAEGQKSLAQLTAEGKIPVQKNPFYMITLKKNFGELAARDYATSLQQAAAADPGLQNSTDSADFGKFEAEFRQNYLKSQGDQAGDPSFQRGFGKLADAYSFNVQSQWSAGVAERVKAVTADTINAQVQNILDVTGHLPADQQGAQAATQIQGLVDGFLQNNPKGGRQFNLAVIEGIKRYAINAGRPDLVEPLLRSVKAGPGSSLFGLPEGTTARLEVENAVFAAEDQKDRHYQMNRAHAETVGKDQLWQDMNTALDAFKAQHNGSVAGFDPKPFLQRMEAIDPSTQGREAVQQHIQSWSDDTPPADPETLRHVEMQMHGMDPLRPGHTLTMSELSKKFHDHLISTQQYNEFANQIESRQRQAAAEARADARSHAADPMTRLEKNANYKDAKTYLKFQMVEAFGNNPMAAKQATVDAIYDLKDYLANAYAANPTSINNNQLVRQAIDAAMYRHVTPRMRAALNRSRAAEGQPLLPEPSVSKPAPAAQGPTTKPGSTLPKH